MSKSCTITLTVEQVAIIADELINANDAQRYYLNDESNKNFIDDEERAEIEQECDARSEIISLLCGR